MTQGGGLLQIVAQGKQDVFLTGNPSITWFKFVYRRHTNFAMESQRMYFDGSPNFGQKISCLVPRNGDLLGPMFLKLVLPQLYLSTGEKVGYVNSPGHALIREISIQIGEQEIDRHTGEWLEIWGDLTTDASQLAAYYEMIGKKPGYPRLDTGNNAFDLSGANQTLSKAIFSRENATIPVDISGITVSGGLISPTTKYPQAYDEPIMGPLTLYIPLRFWFNKNPGLYLPLLAMQYHPVRINVTLAPLQDMFYSKQLYNNEDPNVTKPLPNAGLSVQPAQMDIQLWGDYVYLDVPERRRFTSAPLEYLIEQVQYTPPLPVPYNSRSAVLKMDFNHPIKEFIWTLHRNISDSRHEWFNFSSLGFYEIEKYNLFGYPEPLARQDLMVDAKIQLDGQDRFDAREAKYFRLIQPYQRHTRTPFDQYIYVYSIALKPEELQPSGSLNASRIDNMILNMNFNNIDTGINTSQQFGDMTAHIYATNYNVLRVIDGYAGLLFSV